MNKDLICKMYKEGESMRKIALVFNTNHKLISRVLKGKNIQTRKSLNSRGKKKFQRDGDRLYNNMATHLRFDVTMKCLRYYKDFEKLKTLNNAITNRNGRWDVSTEWYKAYIEKFYNNPTFNNVYKRWVKSGYEKYKKPSLDHIIPKSKKGTSDLNNLQFLTWFENRAKNNIPVVEWNNMKKNIKDYLL